MLTPISPRLRLVLAALATLSTTPGQTIPAVAPEIVSAWKSSASNCLLIFRYDGCYFHVNDATTRPGFERGSYAWQKSSGSFSATTVVDTDGTAGLSHPTGATTLAISGNTLTYNAAGSSAVTYSRVLNNALVGSWHAPGGSFTVTFLADNTYYLTDRKNDAPFGYDGIERGTYTWNAASGAFTASPITDTNGDIGLSSLPPGFTFTVSGNVLTYDDGEDSGSFQRVNTSTSPFAFPDFEVYKGADYIQTSDAAPVLATGFPPFFGGASVGETVGATAPTLKIGTRTPLDFIADPDVPGRFELGSEYTSLSNLNANSAYPTATATNYLFKSGTNAATLNFPTGGSIPTPPRVTGGNGTWADGIYSLGDDHTLVWTTQPGYNAATHLTVLDVEDDETGDSIIDGFLIQGEVTSYDFGDQLNPGTNYRVFLTHARIASTTTAGTGVFAGKLGMALYEGASELLVQVPLASAGIPVVSEQPVSQVIQPGATARLTVGSTHEGCAYQWFRGGSALPGQTGNSLTLVNFQNADVAAYRVTLSNDAGSVTSNSVTLMLPTSTAGPQTITFPAISPQTPTDENDPITLAATSSSGLPVSYTVVSGPATLSGSSLTLTNTGTVVVRASQSGNALFTAATPVEISITVSATADPFLAFVAGLPADQRDPDDDADGDGVANLLEYLLGGNPAAPDAAILPVVTGTAVPGGRNLVFTYRRKLAATGVTQLVEHSPTLAPPWTPAVHGQNGVTIATTPVDAATEQVTVTVPTTGGTRFVRLNASL